ncbi:rust resistance kinase Lr10-like [Neltuma alba]|uniref:rust resistance kinase Lr10-like n=1 Tax=Neltuma alba TaxID=207710 RepID=UPI0010A2C4FD|nr:rust resistance kinase Lr10-like [Prosopis alba]
MGRGIIGLIRFWGLMYFTLVYVTSQTTSFKDESKTCNPSHCGIITNISYPFRLRDDNCGDPAYELACENNITLLDLHSGTYQVLGINYKNYTIRVKDPGIREGDCSSLPRYFLSRSNFSDTYNGSFEYDRNNPYAVFLEASAGSEATIDNVIYLDCSDPVRDDADYVDTAPCVDWGSKGDGGGHVYAVVGDLEAGRLKPECRVKSVATIVSDWSSFLDWRSYSYADIHTVLSHGFEISSWPLACLDIHCGTYETCVLDDRTQKVSTYWWWDATWFVGILFLFILLIYTWRRRHLSGYGSIEDFIRLHSLHPLRYSYKDLKTMTNGFKTKLGEGGFGTVYKGKLRSGPDVAIKMLGDKSKATCQDFINEVATLGRIHRFNVVRLVGFCVEGTKHALIYESMSNGSLDKHIFVKEGQSSLNYHKIYEISLGVARGIAYLHHGSDMQILHFDIKPHNILLDDNLTPKISDFGLAKLYSSDNSIATLTAARGTIGYLAPELFYKNIGKVSYKSDVYSFGMLLMEMTSRRRNLNPHAEHSSQLYFPLWIYDQFDEEKDIEMEDLIEEDKALAKKMFIVALWCIQFNPVDRPSMNKVIEMLEVDDVQSLEMPPKPSIYPDGNVRANCDQTSSLPTSSDGNLGEDASDET